MIYHDVSDQPARLGVYPAAIAGLLLCAAAGLGLAAWAAPGGQLALGLVAGGGLVRARTLAGFRDFLPIAAAAVGVSILFGESQQATWSYAPLWLGLAVAVDARFAELAWPREHLPWRSFLRALSGTLCVLSALGTLTPGLPIELRRLGAGLTVGLALAAATASLWHPPLRSAEVDGKPRDHVRERCPRCGAFEDWPLEHPGTCGRCGLKRVVRIEPH